MWRKHFIASLKTTNLSRRTRILSSCRNFRISNSVTSRRYSWIIFNSVAINVKSSPAARPLWCFVFRCFMLFVLLSAGPELGPFLETLFLLPHSASVVRTDDQNTFFHFSKTASSPSTDCVRGGDGRRCIKIKQRKGGGLNDTRYSLFDGR